MTNGIHHITAIASDAKQTLDFYSRLLGLRLVKATVNQDDTQTYHLFFGDQAGQPGMDLTFFIFQPPRQGKVGNGLVTTISLAVPDTALVFWQERFATQQVKQQPIRERFGRPRLTFTDFDGQQLELVGVPESELDTTGQVWNTADITEAQAIRSFYSATLSVVSLDSIEAVLSHVLGYAAGREEGQTHQYQVDSPRAGWLEVTEQPSALPGLNAAGTVHHVAFRAKDEEEQLKMRERVFQVGLYPTEVINRFYFKSVYFRTEAGILFEIATDGPGFTADESLDQLGQKLALPPFLEPEREAIEAQLNPPPTKLLAAAGF